MQKTENLATINRHFAFIMTGCLLLLGAVIPYLKGKAFHFPLLAAAGILFIAGLLFPMMLEQTRQKWLWLGEKLGHINSRIIFTVIYLGLFSFVHLVFFLTGRDKMLRRWKKYSSTFKEKKSISSFKDPF